MANERLLPIYKELFEEDFCYYDFNQRMKMQKAIYLLQAMGAPVGGYSYRWYLHGPYSQVLQDDMYAARDGKAKELAVSEESSELIAKLGEVFRSEERGGYSVTDWVECLGSMYYLQERIMSSDADQKAILAKLVEEKPHLSDETVNAAAYRLLEGLFAV